MKRLILLFFLFPGVLSAQIQQKKVIEPDKEIIAKNIQSISGVTGSSPFTRAAEILVTHNVTDSGEHITTTVFFRNLTALDSASFDIITDISPSVVDKFKTDAISAWKEELVTGIPDLPDFIGDEIVLKLLTQLELKLNDIAVDKLEIIAALPNLPLVKTDEMPTLQHLALNIINTADIAAVALELITTLPNLPLVKTDEIPIIKHQPYTQIIIADLLPEFVAIKTNLPPLPFFIADDIDDIILHPAVKLYTAQIPIGKADSVSPFVMIEEELFGVDSMHLSEEGYSLLEKLEGYSPDLYSLNDGGYTIGFGFFVPYSEGSKWRKGVTWEEAERLIHQKVPSYENQVKEFINVMLTQREFDALTMLAYNLGGFSKATSIVNDVNNLDGFDQLQKDWKRFIHSKAPNVSKGLMNRRKDELGVRSIADYQPDRKVIIYKNRN